MTPALDDGPRRPRRPWRRSPAGLHLPPHAGEITIEASSASSSAATQGRRRVAAFDPSSLAGLTLRLDPTVATLYQDSAGSTPVTAGGQPVGRWVDTSGVGRLYTSAGTERPTYRASAMGGGRPCVEFAAGASTVLTATSSWSPSGALTVAIEYQLTTTSLGSYQALLCLLGSVSGMVMLHNSGSYQTLSWCFGYGSSASVGVGGVSGAGLDLLRHRLVIAYSGGTPSAPGSYTAELDGVAVTPVASGSYGSLPGASLGRYSSGSYPISAYLGRTWIWSQSHAASLPTISAGLGP